MGNQNSLANKTVFQVTKIGNVCVNYFLYENQKLIYDKPIKEKCFEKLILIPRNIKEIQLLVHNNIIYGIYDFEKLSHIFLLSPNLSPTSYGWIVHKQKS